MMETIDVTKTSYEKTLQYYKQEIDGKLRRKEERSWKSGRKGRILYVMVSYLPLLKWHELLMAVRKGALQSGLRPGW